MALTRTAVVENANEEPYWFLASPGELSEALSRIPNRVLLAAYKRAWHGKPPRRTAKSLRGRILAIHRRASRSTVGKPRVVPLLDAARELGVSSRTLRREIEAGTRQPEYLGRGARGLRILAVELPPDTEPLRWLLIPNRLRPDPRSRPLE